MRCWWVICWPLAPVPSPWVGGGKPACCPPEDPVLTVAVTYKTRTALRLIAEILAKLQELMLLKPKCYLQYV